MQAISKVSKKRNKRKKITQAKTLCMIFHATNASASQWSIEAANHRSSQSSACVACGFCLRNARIACNALALRAMRACCVRCVRLNGNRA